MKYWGRCFGGVALMLGLEIIGQPSPPEKPAPTFPTLAVGPAISGTNVSARTGTWTSGLSAETLTFPAVHPSIILQVQAPAQTKASLREKTIEARKTLPPPWASDEQRGVRKKFRG